MKVRSSLLVCIIVIMLLIPYEVSGQTEAGMDILWQQPLLVGAGWFPSITVDATDTAHLVWGTGEGGERLDGEDTLIDRLFYVKVRPDAQPEAPNDVVVTGMGGFTVRNAIGVDSRGILHTFFRTGDHNYIQSPGERASDASYWINQETLSTGYYLDLLVDSHDNIHAVSSVQNSNLTKLGLQNEANINPTLSEEYPCLFCADLVYYRSTDGGRTWSSRVNVSDSFSGSERHDIVEGHSGRLYISWSEGFDWYVNDGQAEDVRFVYSDDQGATWSKPIILDGGGTPGKRPTQFELTEFGGGKIMGIWRYDLDNENLIYFQISEDDGQTWTDPVPVPYFLGMSNNTLDKYELLTDLQETVHLFAVGYDEDTRIGPGVYHMEYRQGRWLRPQLIFYEADILRPEYIQGAVGPLNDLNVTWFVRTGQSPTYQEYGLSAIYYARRTGNLPATALLEEYPPTATPQVSPTIVPTFEPTATMLPTLASLQESMDVVQRNRDQNATQTLLGAVFAVSILCVGVLVLSGFRPRL